MVTFRKYKMPEPQFKRNIAFKLRIAEILAGKPVLENEKFLFLEADGKKVSRVNVVASIVDKYDVNAERKYVFLTLDDGSGQIKAKLFGDDSEKLRGFEMGETVTVIGTLRYFNNEVYISPEIIKEIDPKYLIVRKLETEKTTPALTPLKTSGVREKVIDMIKNAEKDGGLETATMQSKLPEFSEAAIKEEIRKLLEEGMAFEPRPGKVRWLG